MARTPEQIAAAYRIAKGVYQGKLDKRTGIQTLSVQSGLKLGSAQIIIGQVFPSLIKGEEFTRTLAFPFFKYFVEQIHIDYGEDGLINALEALDKHIKYIATKGDSKIQLKAFCKSYEAVRFHPLGSVTENEMEQNEIVDYLSKTKTREEIINDLKKVKPTDPQLIEINRKAYKRDNKTIAQIKIVRDFKCQICGHFILKKDGSKYIEAAHVTAKSEKGTETPDNIILLCPNHHKEFDFGNRQIIRRDGRNIVIELNGVLHDIDVSVD